jgi:transposase InsO family protein
LRRPLEPKQYTSGDYATLADDLAVTLSNGRTGQCWDNALAESFFASLKGECLDQQPWPTRAAARRATVEYIAYLIGLRQADAFLRAPRHHPGGRHSCRPGGVHGRTPQPPRSEYRGDLPQGAQAVGRLAGRAGEIPADPMVRPMR